MALRSSSSNAGIATAVPSVPVPTGVAANDIIVLLYSADGAAQATPSGFTQLDTTTSSFGPDGETIRIYWKRATGADTGTYSWTGSANSWSTQAFAFSGRDATNPPVAGTLTQTGTVASATTLSVSATGVTALVGDDLLWAVGVDTAGSQTISSLSTIPTGFSSIAVQSDTGGFGGTASAHQDNVSAGATGTVTGTLTFSGASTHASGSWVIRIPTGPPTVSIDASTPGIIEGVGSTGTTTPVTSNSFAPPANSLIVVFAIYASNGASVSSMSDSLASHLTYSKLISSATTNVCAEIWLADAPATAPGAMTVTPTYSVAVTPTTASIGVLVLTGAASRAAQLGKTVSATATTGAPSATLPAGTVSTSWILSAIGVKVGTAPTVPAGQTTTFNAISQQIVNATVAKMFCIQGNTAVGNTNVTINDTAPTGVWGEAVAEILLAGGTAHTTSQSGTLSFTGVQANSTSRPLAASGSFIGSTSRAVTRALTAGLPFSGALSRLTARLLTATLSFVGAFVVMLRRSLAASLAFSGSVARGTSRTLTGALSFAGNVTKQVRRALTATLSASGTLGVVRAITQALSAGLSFAGSLASQRLHRLSLSGATSFTGVTTRRTARLLTAVWSAGGGLGRTGARRLSAALSFTGAQGKRLAYALTGTVAPTGGLARAGARALVGAVSFAGSQAKLSGARLSAASSFAGSINRQTSRLITAVLTGLGALSPLRSGGGVFTTTLAASLTTGGALARRTSRSLLATLAPVGATTLRLVRLVTGSVTSGGHLSRSTGMLVTAALSVAGTLSRSMSRLMTATGSFIGTVQSALVSSLISVALSATLSTTGAITRHTSRVINAGIALGGHLIALARRIATSGRAVTLYIVNGLKALWRQSPLTSMVEGSVAITPEAPELIQVSTAQYGLTSDTEVWTLIVLPAAVRTVVLDPLTISNVMLEPAQEWAVREVGEEQLTLFRQTSEG